LKILVLGAEGMLGSSVFEYLQKSGLDTYGTSRDTSLLDGNNIFIFDAMSKESLTKIDFSSFDYLINCIGLIKPRIVENDILSIQTAYKINSIFPWILSNHLATSATRIIQIATDCVYDGQKGDYNENSKFSPVDNYGSSKLFGEVVADNIRHLRCSIIGPEKKDFVSLFEWFSRLPTRSVIQGYLNHKWNGVTTLGFSKIVKSIVVNNKFESLPQITHIVPSTTVNKYELLEIFKKYLKRDDITVEPTEAQLSVDRTLSTIHENINKQLWNQSDYLGVQSIDRMVSEMISSLKIPRDPNS
jgi:dTDP-4-dehydrorhamnose reductase